MRKIFWFTSVLWILVFNSRASVHIDSLRNLLNSTQPDSISICQQLNSFHFLPSSEYQAKRMIMHWAISHSGMLKNYFLLSKCYLFLGHEYYKTQNYIRASETLDTALIIADHFKSHLLLGKIYNEKGNIENDFVQFKKAIEYYKLSIRESGLANDKKMMVVAYSNLSTMYFLNHIQHKDSMRMAIELSKEALRIQFQLNQPIEALSTLDALAYMYLEIGEMDLAVEMLRISDSILAINPREDRFIIYHFRNATALSYQGRPKEVIKELDKGIDLLKKYNALRWEFLYHRYYARAYVELKDHLQANRHFERYIQLHDSVISRGNYQRAATLYAQFEAEKKEDLLNDLKRENIIVELKLLHDSEQQRGMKIQVIMVILVLIFMVGLVLVLYSSRKNLSTEQAILMEKQEQSKMLSIKMRNQISKLSRYQAQMQPHFIFNVLQGIQGKLLQGKDEECVEYLSLFMTLLQSTNKYVDVQYLKINDEINFLRSYWDFELRRLNAKIDLNIQSNCTEIIIPPFLVQPLLENSIKHGGLCNLEDGRIDVLMNCREDDTVLIVVSDDGKGTAIPTAQLLVSSHALSILEKRISMLWEETKRNPPCNFFEINSKPNLGFKVKMLIPSRIVSDCFPPLSL